MSNLSYSTSQEALQAAFDDLAPVRSCFIVYEKDPLDATSKGQSKGVGYVTFAIREDAEGIIERYSESGGEQLKINGRVARVKWADRKVRLFSCVLLPPRTEQRRFPAFKRGG